MRSRWVWVPICLALTALLIGAAALPGTPSWLRPLLVPAAMGTFSPIIEDWWQRWRARRAAP